MDDNKGKNIDDAIKGIADCNDVFCWIDIKIIGHLRIINELSAGGSAGNLKKWLLEDDKGLIWAKSRSKENTFEPEAEVCAYRLACLFGVPAEPYSLTHIRELADKPLCISRDYSSGYKVMSLFRYLISCGINGIATSNGIEKFNLVESVLSDADKQLHRAILLFDYIVGNTDRHLRNFDVRVDSDGRLKGLVNMYDTGAALFSDEPDMFIEQSCKQGDNFMHSKPYINPHYSQLKLLNSVGCSGLLRQVYKAEIYKTINSCFKGNRAKWLGTYVMQNAERLGLIC